MAAIDDIQDAIDKLSVLLDSDAYMKMVNDPNTSAQDEDLLKAAFVKRSQLVQALLKLYADKIDETTPQFQTLVGQMNTIATTAADAISTLNAYTERVKFAAEVASYLDTALKYAMALAKA